MKKNRFLFYMFFLTLAFSSSITSSQSVLPTVFDNYHPYSFIDNKKLNKTITDLHQSGKMHAIYAKYGVAVPTKEELELNVAR